MKPMILALLISQTGESVPASAIQAKIDRAAAKAVVELPLGTIDGQLTIKRTVTMRGQGKAKTLLRGSQAGPVISILVPTEDSEVKIEYLEITNGGWNKKPGHLTRQIFGGGVYIDGS